MGVNGEPRRGGIEALITYRIKIEEALGSFRIRTPWTEPGLHNVMASNRCAAAAALSGMITVSDRTAENPRT
jgi:hypothetical protein